jgi:hypothetical protein
VQLLENYYEIKSIVEKKWEFEENYKQELMEYIEDHSINLTKNKFITGRSSIVNLH